LARDGAEKKKVDRIGERKGKDYYRKSCEQGLLGGLSGFFKTGGGVNGGAETQLASQGTKTGTRRKP